MGAFVATVLALSASALGCGDSVFEDSSGKDEADPSGETTDFRVFFKLTAARTDERDAEASLSSLDGVEEVQFVTKKEGLRILAKRLPKDMGQDIKDLNSGNPLPDAVTVHMTGQVDLGTFKDQVASALGPDARTIQNVNYARVPHS